MNRVKSVSVASGAIALSFGLGIAQAFAKTDSIVPQGQIDNNSNSTGYGSIADFIKTFGGKILSIIFLLAGIVAVIYLVYNGIQYITSAGNADKVKLARSGVINAIIGIIIIAAAYYIINFAIGASGVLQTETTKGGGTQPNTQY